MLEEQKQYGLNVSLQKIGKFALVLYIIFSFITSAGFVPDIFHSLSLYFLVFIAMLNVLMGAKIFVNKYLVWYFLFIVLSLFGVINTPTNDWWTVLYRVVIILAVCFSLTCFVKDKEDFYSVIYAFVIGATLLMLMVIFSGRLHEDERLGTTLMENANHFAAMYMITVMLSTWYILYGENRKYKILMAITIVLNFYALLLSGGRKYVIIPFVFAYFALIFRVNKRGKRNIFLYTVIIVAVAVLMYLLVMNNDVLYQSVGRRFEGLIETFFGDGAGDNSSQIRKKMMALAWEHGWETPIFGHGFDSFKYLNKQVLEHNAYSHNNWMEIWYNHGLVGMVLYYGFYVMLVVGAIKNRNKSPKFSAFIVSAIVSIFIFEFGAVDYEMMPIQIFLCLASIVENFKNPKRNNYGEN